MEGVHKLETITSEKKYGKRLGVISEFAKNLNVYFGVVDILVSSNPQYAALAWGAFRLLLQVPTSRNSCEDSIGPRVMVRF